MGDAGKQDASALPLSQSKSYFYTLHASPWLLFSGMLLLLLLLTASRGKFFCCSINPFLCCADPRQQSQCLVCVCDLEKDMAVQSQPWCFFLKSTKPNMDRKI